MRGDSKVAQKLLATVVALIVMVPAFGEDSIDVDADIENNLTMAMAWRQTAAEYRALYHQGFNLARMRIELALAQ
ncbi:MAG: hypothetical protein HOE21_02665 [Proteobacteria bacterium]|nr:hypothetical protein [Pseudomonadota bacterium]